MKADKAKYILEVFERFKIRLKNDKTYKYSKANGDKICFSQRSLEIDLANGDYNTILYEDIKIIEVFE